MTSYRKIKTADIALLREQILLEQQGLCALCNELIEEGKAVLDHCHTTGQIRGVLHRGCNAFEGNIVNAMPRNLITLERLHNILARLMWYHSQLKPLVHPTHLTQEERAQRAKKRAQAKRKKKP
jgi:hypothetical protein